MSALRLAIVSILMTFFLMGFVNRAQSAPNVWPNKGEVCIYNQGTGGHVTLAVLRTVGNNFIVHGYANDSGEITLLNGNAILDGNTVYLHVTGSGYDDSQGEVHGVLSYAVMDLDSMDGWTVGIGHHCDETNPCGLEYEGPQDLIFEPCQ
jgi:hypothetical protein